MIFSEDLDNFLKRIIDIPTPSGFEQQGQEYFKTVTRQYIDNISTDIMGNVIAYKKGKSKRKLMISAHIDEIGFMVKYIDDNGMLYIVPVGGIDMMLLPGSRLVVHNNGNSFLGIIGRKPIHLLNEMERKSFNIEDTWLDLGFTSKKHALHSVAVGDMATFGTELSPISDDYVIAHSLDNKIGCMILLGIKIGRAHV
jgi:endoglucanase